MKVKVIIGMISALAFAPVLLAADQKSENAMQTSKVLQTLKSKGFNIVSKIESKTDGEYEVKVINGEGRSGKITFNAHTGKIEKAKENQPGLTALDVAKKVEEAGYVNISKIDTKWLEDKYNVTAFDKDGKKVDLEVDALSGKITKD